MKITMTAGPKALAASGLETREPTDMPMPELTKLSKLSKLRNFANLPIFLWSPHIG